MGNITKLLVLIIWIFLLFGGIYVYSLSKVEVRSINFNNLGDISLSGFTLNGYVEVYNGGLIPIGIDHIQYDVILEKTGDRLANGYVQGATISPGKIEQFHITNRINWIPTAEMAVDLLNPGGTYIKISGNVYIVNLQIIEFKMPFQQRFDIKQYISQFITNTVQQVVDTGKKIINEVGNAISNNQNSQKKSQIVEGKFVQLNKESTYESGKVKITEFLKFNCGRCYALNQQIPALKQKYGDKLEIVYIPMLWRTVPQEAGFEKSIEAYILAQKMGKGKEMKDALFKAEFVDKKDLTNLAVLGDIGKSVGLGDDYVKALNNGDVKNDAEANINLAESFQVNETPTIIINGNLKVTPSMANGDMKDNLNTIISSLLGTP